MLEVTDDAKEVLARAYSAAARFNPDARIRISLREDEVETSFVPGPAENDEVLEIGELVLYVAREVGDRILDTAEEHDRLVLKKPFERRRDSQDFPD